MFIGWMAVSTSNSGYVRPSLPSPAHVCSDRRPCVSTTRVLCVAAPLACSGSAGRPHQDKVVQLFWTWRVCMQTCQGHIMLKPSRAGTHLIKEP